MHTKKKIRDDNELNFRLVGNILDRIVQFGNDRRTNGVPIGPAISDLVAEIILTAVDRLFSRTISKEELIAARYKDDYFFLIKSDDQIDKVLKSLQNCFKEFNLFINEEKTIKYMLPDGLFRPWILRFNETWHSLVNEKNSKIKFRDFFTIAQEVFKIDAEYPGTGVIDKFIAKLTDKNNDYQIKIDFSDLQNKRQGVFRTYSLLLHLSKRSKKSFPNALGVIESIIRAPNSKISFAIKSALIDEMKNLNQELLKTDDEHKKLWWIYFVLTNNMVKTKISIKEFYKTESTFLKSYKKRKQLFFKELNGPNLFLNPVEDINNPIAKYLNVFNKI